MPIHLLLSEAGLISTKLLLDFCQKSYAYWLLTLPDLHFTKLILPISLKKGDKNSQPREQPKDMLMWAKVTMLKMLGLILAQQVASHYSIDLADDIELVSYPGLNINFSANIIIDAKKKILKEAKKYYAKKDFWIERSKLSEGNIGAAIY